MAIRTHDISLRILTCRFEQVEQWRYHNLKAPYWRFYWNKTPGWSIRFQTSTVQLKPASVVLIPPETPFSGRSDCPGSQLYIHFTAAHPFDCARPGVYVQESATYMPAIKELVRAHAEMDSRYRISALVQAICFGALAGLPDKVLQSTQFSARVTSAMDLITSNPAIPPDNGLIGKQLCMNPNSFIRLFKQETGLTPQAWSLLRRIEHACMLLHHSPLKIEQIAEQTGFCDRAHFTKVFTKHRGMGPSKFRKEAAGL